ncbi:hypothetical protein [Geodermatophilus sp. FMUSA9-8]|uniref:hypothetical protein n=1 Tax=Geodermatophilus sp. FMUSA9-8 TaxID=3120155 RepID=UPI00300B94E8
MVLSSPGDLLIYVPDAAGPSGLSALLGELVDDELMQSVAAVSLAAIVTLVYRWWSRRRPDE